MLRNDGLLGVENISPVCVATVWLKKNEKNELYNFLDISKIVRKEK